MYAINTFQLTLARADYEPSDTQGAKPEPRESKDCSTRFADTIGKTNACHLRSIVVRAGYRESYVRSHRWYHTHGDFLQKLHLDLRRGKLKHLQDCDVKVTTVLQNECYVEIEVDMWQPEESLDRVEEEIRPKIRAAGSDDTGRQLRDTMMSVLQQGVKLRRLLEAA